MATLDQIVKGAPQPSAQALEPLTHPSPINASIAEDTSPTDPIHSLPSSPPQIYLNLLILEASLRAQYLSLRLRRRQHLCFVSLLLLWILYFGYALFLAPREDGSGVGGSVYWVVEVAEKVCLMGGVVTGLLVWGTGQWERGVRWPRRWSVVANRGLRGFGVKVVVLRRGWFESIWDLTTFLFGFGWMASSGAGSGYRYVDKAIALECQKAVSHEKDKEKSALGHAHPHLDIALDGNGKGLLDDISPGGDHVKLLLLPKPFSPAFREGWDVYRNEYWECENERRRIVRAKVTERDRRLARDFGGWFWWTRWRAWRIRSGWSDEEMLGAPRPGAHQSTSHPLGAHTHGAASIGEKSGAREGKGRLRSGSMRNSSHSRNSSRSATPALVDDGASTLASKPVARSKSASTKLKKRNPGSSGKASSGPRDPTPNALRRGDSYESMDSLRPRTSIESLRPGTSDGDGEGDGEGEASLRVEREGEAVVVGAAPARADRKGGHGVESGEKDSVTRMSTTRRASDRPGSATKRKKVRQKGEEVDG